MGRCIAISEARMRRGADTGGLSRRPERRRSRFARGKGVTKKPAATLFWAWLLGWLGIGLRMFRSKNSPPFNRLNCRHLPSKKRSFRRYRPLTPHLRGAAVGFVGNPAIDRQVEPVVAVEQVERDAHNPDPPAA